MSIRKLVYGLWLLLVAYLTVSAVDVKQERQSHLGQSLGLTLGLVASFVAPRLPLFNWVNHLPANRAVRVFGLGLTVAGMAVLVWARQTLGRNWSQTVAVKVEPELVTTGPYHYVRHPMYTGGLVAALGSAIAVRGAWVFLSIILGSLFLWRVGAEDELLAGVFPDQFPAYRRRTKALIPFVW
jgi:protein-S-isoprenylcysteine O-methyltransferase